MITITDDTTNKVITSVKLNDIKTLNLRKEITLENIKVDKHKLIYVVSGEMETYIKDETIAVKQKELMLLPSQKETISVSIFDETIFYVAAFTCSNIEAFANPNKHLLIKDAETYYGHFKSMNIYKESVLYKQNEADIKLLNILEDIKFTMCHDQTSEELALKIHDYALEYISDITKIKEKIRYSNDYIPKLFRKEFGESLKQHIIDDTLQSAEELLIHTHEEINTIAETLGWDDSNKFIKFFKYHKKKSPTTFRKENRII